VFNLFYPSSARLTPKGDLFKMALSRPKYSQHRKFEISSISSRSIANVKMPAPRFITFRLKVIERNMRNFNPFYLQKILGGIAGKVKNAPRLKNRTLLKEVQNDRQAEVLLEANLLESCPTVIQIERHSSLNFSRGVINADLLDGMLNEEIQSCLADQFVS
jgi:hypothetical protein